jgi:hypothetical protein
MRLDIVKKLDRVLQERIDSEPLVVYLLCEVRKLLDYEKHPPTPLRMFCNWALHVDLTYPSNTRPFIQSVDAVVAAIVASGTTAALSAQQALVQEFATFDSFRIDLLEFLSRHGLPTDLCVRDDLWFAFLEAYALVIEDGSLFCPVTTIDAVTFSTRPPGMTPSDLSFAPTWLVWLKQPHNGHTALEISAEVSGTTYSWGFRWR